VITNRIHFIYKIPQKKYENRFIFGNELNSSVAINKAQDPKSLSMAMPARNLILKLCHGRRLAGKQESSALSSGVILLISILVWKGLK